MAISAFHYLPCWPMGVMAVSTSHYLPRWPMGIMAVNASHYLPCWRMGVMAASASHYLPNWPKGIMTISASHYLPCWPMGIMAASASHYLPCLTDGDYGGQCFPLSVCCFYFLEILFPVSARPQLSPVTEVAAWLSLTTFVWGEWQHSWRGEVAVQGKISRGRSVGVPSMASVDCRSSCQVA